MLDDTDVRAVVHLGRSVEEAIFGNSRVRINQEDTIEVHHARGESPQLN